MSLLDRPLDVIPVPIPADCADGFEAAYWRRPDAYLDPQVWRPMSALALIPDADRECGCPSCEVTDTDSGSAGSRWMNTTCGYR